MEDILTIQEDEKFMKRCIELSEESLKKGDAPFGSIVVKDGKIIAESSNNKENRVSDHAEVLALHQAHKVLGTSKLTDCTLYTNCEPCPMCSFMIREYAIKKVVFALPSKFMGGYSKWNILQDEELSKFSDFFGKPPEVRCCILEKEAKKVFDKFPILWMFGSNVELK
ncbi:MAG: nucleoside deaminase [Candidatus Woesearchaeota archaeon]